MRAGFLASTRATATPLHLRPYLRRLRHSSTMALFQAPVIDQVIPLSDGRMAYEQVAQGDVRGRVVLVP